MTVAFFLVCKLRKFSANFFPLLDQNLSLSTPGSQLTSNPELNFFKSMVYVSNFLNSCLKEHLLVKKIFQTSMYRSLLGNRAVNKFNSCNNGGILEISILSAFRIIFRNFFHFILEVLLHLLVLFIVLNLVTVFSTESLAEQIKAMMHSQLIDKFWACSRSLVKDFPFHF